MPPMRIVVIIGTCVRPVSLRCGLSAACPTIAPLLKRVGGGKAGGPHPRISRRRRKPTSAHAEEPDFVVGRTSATSPGRFDISAFNQYHTFYVEQPVDDRNKRGLVGRIGARSPRISTPAHLAPPAAPHGQHQARGGAGVLAHTGPQRSAYDRALPGWSPAPDLPPLRSGSG